MDDLDREICTVLGVDPSPQFAARVRMAVAARPLAPLSSRWFGPVMAAVALVTLAVGIAVFRVERAHSVAPPMGVTSAARICTDLTLRPDTASPGEPRPLIHATLDTRVTAKRVETLEVIVLKDQVDAHLRLFTSVRDQPGSGTWTLDDTTSVTNQSLSDIRISPITIESLNLSTTEEGVLQ